MAIRQSPGPADAPHETGHGLQAKGSPVRFGDGTPAEEPDVMESSRLQRAMRTHRFQLFATWLFVLVGLLVFPGFEAKGLVFGLIIGHWPFAILGEIGDGITLLSMFVLSAAEIGFCAWLLDKMRLPLHAWGAMAMAVCVGMAITYWENVGEFSRFKSSLIVHSMPESYVVGWADFFRLLLMPKTLVGGMWGLYLATAILVVYAAASAPFRKTPPAANGVVPLGTPIS